MNINDLTIGQALEIVAMFGKLDSEKESVEKPEDLNKAGAASSVQKLTDAINAVCKNEKEANQAKQPVLVCTDKRGVVFGYTECYNARPIILTDARMCLYWSTDVGGVFGLADIGPTKNCKISAPCPSVTLEGVTAVFEVTANAVKAWASAPIQGR